MVTLAQAKLNVQDDLQLGIIDEFAKSSYIMNNIPFADVVSPTGGGATLTYGYTRLITQPKAEFRKVNAEYGTHEVEKQRYTTDLKVFGGAFSVDRIIAGMGGIVDEVALQSSQKVKAASALFSDTIINGNSSTNENVFDGLDVAVTGSSTEYNAGGTVIDLSTSAQVDANYKLFVDLGAKAGSNDPIVGIDGSGKTSIYAVKFGIDGFHAISMAGQPPVRVWLPDFSTAGAVKKGEVEMVAGCALKATKAAGVFRNIKVK